MIQSLARRVDLIETQQAKPTVLTTCINLTVEVLSY